MFLKNSHFEPQRSYKHGSYKNKAFIFILIQFNSLQFKSTPESPPAVRHPVLVELRHPFGLVSSVLSHSERPGYRFAALQRAGILSPDSRRHFESKGRF